MEIGLKTSARCAIMLTRRDNSYLEPGFGAFAGTTLASIVAEP